MSEIKVLVAKPQPSPEWRKFKSFKSIQEAQVAVSDLYKEKGGGFITKIVRTP